MQYMPHPLRKEIVRATVNLRQHLNLAPQAAEQPHQPPVSHYFGPPETPAKEDEGESETPAPQSQRQLRLPRKAHLQPSVTPRQASTTVTPRTQGRPPVNTPTPQPAVTNDPSHPARRDQTLPTIDEGSAAVTIEPSPTLFDKNGYHKPSEKKKSVRRKGRIGNQRPKRTRVVAEISVEMEAQQAAAKKKAREEKEASRVNYCELSDSDCDGCESDEEDRDGEIFAEEDDNGVEFDPDDADALINYFRTRGTIPLLRRENEDNQRGPDDDDDEAVIEVDDESDGEAEGDQSTNKSKRRKHDSRYYKVLKSTIAGYYEVVEDAPPPEEWKGEGALFSRIRKMLKKKKSELDNRQIDRIIRPIWKSLNDEVEIAGITMKRGRNPIIEEGSQSEKLIADCKEDAMSDVDTLTTLNEFRYELNLELLGINALRGAIKRMKPRTQTIKKANHGFTDPEADWCKARFNFVLQMLVSTGDVTVENLVEMFESEDKIPSHFHPDNLERFHKDAVAFWDESHKKCVVSDYGGAAKTHTQFPRDENGDFDRNGEYLENVGHVRTFKYDQEFRASFGCAIHRDVTSIPGQVVRQGRRLLFFDYTGKKMRSHKEWTALEKNAMYEVRSKSQESKKSGGWVVSGRVEGVIYTVDPVTKLPGIGKKTGEALNKCGIETTSDLKELLDNTDKTNAVMEKMPVNNKGKKQISTAVLEKLIKKVNDLDLCDEAIPADIDYTRADNPFKERYGDEWEDRIRQHSALRGSVPVTDMIKHIWSETHKHFKGGAFEKDWKIYHDALSIMFEKTTVQWMRNNTFEGKSYYDRLVLPQLGVNQQLGRYGSKPVGNSPELMPWDACLNQDAHEGARRHAVLSKSCLKRQGKTEDDRAFSMATPRLCSENYRRVMDPDPYIGVAPSAKRIVQDFDGVWIAMKIICDAKGCYVPGLAERTGRRYIKSATRGRHGGSRAKGDHEVFFWGKMKGLHKDLKEMRREGNAARVRLANGAAADE